MNAARFRRNAPFESPRWADRVAGACIERYDALPRAGKPGPNEWTPLAGFVAFLPDGIPPSLKSSECDARERPDTSRAQDSSCLENWSATEQPTSRSYDDLEGYASSSSDFKIEPTSNVSFTPPTTVKCIQPEDVDIGVRVSQNCVSSLNTKGVPLNSVVAASFGSTIESSTSHSSALENSATSFQKTIEPSASATDASINNESAAEFQTTSHDQTSSRSVWRERLGGGASDVVEAWRWEHGGVVKCVSLGTGSKCLGGGELGGGGGGGELIHDSHAEVLARRGFLRYLLHQAERALAHGDSEVLVAGAFERCVVRSGVSFHMFVSEPPCGDAAIFPSDEHERLRARRNGNEQPPGKRKRHVDDDGAKPTKRDGKPAAAADAARDRNAAQQATCAARNSADDPTARGRAASERDHAGKGQTSKEPTFLGCDTRSVEMLEAHVSEIRQSGPNMQGGSENHTTRPTLTDSQANAFENGVCESSRDAAREETYRHPCKSIVMLETNLSKVHESSLDVQGGRPTQAESQKNAFENGVDESGSRDSAREEIQRQPCETVRHPGPAGTDGVSPAAIPTLPRSPRSRHVASGRDVHRTGAKCVGGGVQDERAPGAGYHVTGAVRTKPGRGDPTLSVSCSDKMARWHAVGVQGALLSLLVSHPVRLRSVVLAGGVAWSAVSLRRALAGRAGADEPAPAAGRHPGLEDVSALAHAKHSGDKEELSDGKDRALAVAQGSLRCPTAREAGAFSRPAAAGLVWSDVPSRPHEVVARGRKQGVTKKSAATAAGRLSVCRKELAREFVRVASPYARQLRLPAPDSAPLGQSNDRDRKAPRTEAGKPRFQSSILLRLDVDSPGQGNDGQLSENRRVLRLQAESPRVGDEASIVSRAERTELSPVDRQCPGIDSLRPAGENLGVSAAVANSAVSNDPNTSLAGQEPAKNASTERERGLSNGESVPDDSARHDRGRRNGIESLDEFIVSDRGCGNNGDSMDSRRAPCELDLGKLTYDQLKSLAVDYQREWRGVRDAHFPGWPAKPGGLQDFVVGGGGGGS